MSVAPLKAVAILSSVAFLSYSQFVVASGDSNEEGTTVEEVLVTTKNKTGIATEMSLETVQLLGIAGAANDPLQAIFALPGVTFSSSDGPGGSDPVIRGSAPQDNAYFIDLIPADYIFHLFGNSIFDEHIIHSFNLYPGAFSSKYGNATGGIVDVTLREPKNQKFTTTLHTSFLTAGFKLESGISENQSFYATYRRSMLDQLLNVDDINEDDDEGFQINQLPIYDDYQLKYNWHIGDNSTLSFVAAGASDTIAATFSANNVEVARDPDFAGPASIEQGFDSQGVVWNWRVGDRELTSIFSHGTGNSNFVYGRDQHEKTDTNRYLSRIFYKQKLSNTHSISTGLSLGDVSYDMDFNAKIVACNDLDPDCSTVDAEYIVYQDKLDLLTHEFYVEDQWLISENLSLNSGVNFSSDNYLNKGRIEPRIKLNYQFNDSLLTHLSVGQYSQLPQLREMIEVLGNPDLTTVKADHYVWGVNQKFGDGWSWNTDVYFKNMTDIVISSEQDSSTNNYSNGAEGEAYGVEFLLRKEMTDRWYGWASLSLAETDRTNSTTGDTVKFEYDKPVLFNLVLNRTFGDFWKVGIKWSYQSGGRYTPVVDLRSSNTNPDLLEPIYGTLNSEQYPDYHRLDFRAEYTRPKNWGHWKFYVDIINVYNRENIKSYEYTPNGKDLILTPSGYGEDVPVRAELGDGLIPSLGFEIQF